MHVNLISYFYNIVRLNNCMLENLQLYYIFYRKIEFRLKVFNSNYSIL